MSIGHSHIRYPQSRIADENAIDSTLEKLAYFVLCDASSGQRLLLIGSQKTGKTITSYKASYMGTPRTDRLTDGLLFRDPEGSDEAAPPAEQCPPQVPGTPSQLPLPVRAAW